MLLTFTPFLGGQYSGIGGSVKSEQGGQWDRNTQIQLSVNYLKDVRQRGCVVAAGQAKLMHRPHTSYVQHLLVRGSLVWFLAV